MVDLMAETKAGQKAEMFVGQRVVHLARQTAARWDVHSVGRTAPNLVGYLAGQKADLKAGKWVVSTAPRLVDQKVPMSVDQTAAH
jgi:hypothetical protein